MSSPTIGDQGVVTIAIDPESPGEVELPLWGGTTTCTAYCSEPVPKGSSVVVLSVRNGRHVEVGINQ